ncbi:MFS transporter [Cellulosimicrobium sp. PMB13]|uniref:MFS transporter n=1 Tax=Cellulosimicrobium sp. PMB13 TaxID=3120158 RepID=UPI003F4B7E22
MSDTSVTETASPRQSPVFRRDRVAHAWIAVRALSEFSEAVWTIGLAWTAVQLASPSAASLIVAAGTLPRALLLLFGGASADRHGSRSVMIWSNVGRLLALAGLIAMSATLGPTTALLVIVAVVLGICDAFYEPAASVAARELVHPSDLPAYAAVFQTVNRVAGLLGSAAAGVVVARWSITGSAALNVVAFLFVTAVLLFVFRARYSWPREADGSILSSVAEGVRFLRANSDTRSLVLSFAAVNVFVAPVLGVGMALRVDTLGAGAELLGAVGVVIGVGAVAGALLALLLKNARVALLAYLLLAAEAALIATLGFGGVAWLLVASALVGLTAGWSSALLSAVFVGAIEENYLGRMIAITRVGDDCLVPLSTVVFGLLVTATSLAFTVVVFGLAFLLLMLAPLRRREIRDFRLA